VFLTKNKGYAQMLLEAEKLGLIDMSFAILVKVTPSDSFTVIAGFNIPGKK
jgi:hypothetical protein